MQVVATGGTGQLTYDIKEVDPGTMTDFFDMNGDTLICKKIDSDVRAPVTTAVTITVTDEDSKFIKIMCTISVLAFHSFVF